LAKVYANHSLNSAMYGGALVVESVESNGASWSPPSVFLPPPLEIRCDPGI
jgi:hypothetical protein